MKPNGVTLQLYDQNNTAYVESGSQQELKLVRLATLPGFNIPIVLPDKEKIFGDKQVDINGWVKFLNIYCDIVFESYYNGHRFGVIAMRR